MSTNYVYTEKNNCQDCYKCIRGCPVKAIKVEEQSASIINDFCICCGHCITVCPAGAKKAKRDISTVKYLLNTHKRVIVSLAPSWASEFPEFDRYQFVGLLKTLGFHEVSETAIGAELVSDHVAKILANTDRGVFISPCCPSVLELVLKYYPQHADSIIKVDTPMLAHGKFLREHYGNDVKIVFIGPCIAKKKEVDQNAGIIDCAITFKRIRTWMEEEGLHDQPASAFARAEFAPFSANKGNLYPIAGGMIAGVRNNLAAKRVSYMSFSGIQTIIPVLDDLHKLGSKSPLFLELLACPEGCVNGPGTSLRNSAAVKRTAILDSYDHHIASPAPIALSASLHNEYNYSGTLPVAISEYTEEQIAETLKSIGKTNKGDELNCAGCGYECCADFARAVLDSKAEIKMCVSYMRRVAQDKASVLIQRMPYGVVIVDRNLRVVESNRIFAELAGPDAVLAYEAKPGLEGADLKQLVPYHQYFQNLFSSHEANLEKDIRTDSHLLHLSIFSIEGRNMLGAIVHNLTVSELNRDEIVKRVRAVIRENLKTVQTIAFHLGENASSMETMLNTIVDIQNQSYDE